MEARKGTIVHDVIGLFFPRRCAACDQALMTFEHSICFACVSDLPRTRFHDDARNKVELLFGGKVQLEAASAFLQFTAGGMVQRMLHRLKYKGDREVGIELGRRMAEDVMASPRFSTVDTVMPVPLHPRKERQRGYNQSQVLVDGLREAWPLEQGGDELLRIVRTSTQTKRGRMDRWKNVGEAFDVAHPETLRDAHVLLVDDVVTTGATLEGCIRALTRAPGVRVSVLTCACA
ncbi:MAG TPA: ComF family protein [Flavobacteriales bacterium]|jgi:ComF family protein|nr:ComF family protein [Flavobacteriales bacterium]